MAHRLSQEKMQRILNENEELEIRIAELEKELDGLLQKSLTEKKPKKGFLSGKGQNKVRRALYVTRMCVREVCA